MASFVEAVRLGVDMIEFDVLTTVDGVVICFHDPVIEETGKALPSPPPPAAAAAGTRTAFAADAAVVADSCKNPFSVPSFFFSSRDKTSSEIMGEEEESWR